MKYISKEKNSPYGKAKIFFCLYSYADKQFFEETKNIVTENENCVLWYNDEETEISEELNSLDEMQLLIIPLSNQILTEKKDILESILAFVSEHKIPVLPLLQSRVKSEAYESVFGNMQYLSQFDDSSFGLSYEEKVKNMVVSVVTDREIQSRIKENFDGFIFLSYRKKDREYAKKLMSMIHQNPEFQSISIWYDDFLIPGEDFNDAILDELVNADIFSLVVTPNLVNEENYVMTKEYPTAEKENKIVFPVEFSKTDNKLLNRYYPEIGKPVSKSNYTIFSEKLSECIEKSGITIKESSSKSTYLLGMAYYYGIGVEINREKGISLLEESAYEGYGDAAKRMAIIYSNSYDLSFIGAAIHYQKKYIDYLKSQFTENKDDILKFAAETEYYITIMNKNELDITSDKKKYITAEKLLKFCDKYNEYDELIRYKCSALKTISDYYTKFEDTDIDNIRKAWQYDNIFLEISMNLYENNKTLQNLEMLLNAYYSLLFHAANPYNENHYLKNELITETEISEYAASANDYLIKYLEQTKNISDSEYKKALKTASDFSLWIFKEYLDDAEDYVLLSKNYFYDYYINKQNKTLYDYFELAEYASSMCSQIEITDEDSADFRFLSDETFRKRRVFYDDANNIIDNIPDGLTDMPVLEYMEKYTDFKQSMCSFYLSGGDIEKTLEILEEMYDKIEYFLLNILEFFTDEECIYLNNQLKIASLIETIYSDNPYDFLSVCTVLYNHGYEDECDYYTEKIKNLYVKIAEKCPANFVQEIIKYRIINFQEIIFNNDEEEISQEETASEIISKVNELIEEVFNVSDDKKSAFLSGIIKGCIELAGYCININSYETTYEITYQLIEKCLELAPELDLISESEIDTYLAVYYWKMNLNYENNAAAFKIMKHLYNESDRYLNSGRLELFYYDVMLMNAVAAMKLYKFLKNDFSYLKKSNEHFDEIYSDSFFGYADYIVNMVYCKYYMWQETAKYEYLKSAYELLNIMDDEGIEGVDDETLKSITDAFENN